MRRRLHVGNLGYRFDVEALRARFVSCGEVAHLRVVTSRRHGRGRGAAIVRMAREQDASHAIERLDTSTFEDRVIRVSYADPRSSRASGAAPLGPSNVVRRMVGLMRFSRRCVGATASSLFFVSDDGESLEGIMSEWDWTRTSFVSKLSGWPTVARSLEDRSIATISLANARDGERGWFEDRNVVRTVCVPLCTTDRRLGVVFFDFDVEPIASKSDTELPLLVDLAARLTRTLVRESFGNGGRTIIAEVDT